MAGVGLAGGQAGLALRCTLPESGLGVGGGSCALVVGSLISWALIEKRRRKGDFWTVPQ